MINKYKKKAETTIIDFITLLEEMTHEYQPDVNENKRWISKHIEVLNKWMEYLKYAKSNDEWNELWGEVQNMSRILGCTLDNEFGRRHRKFQAILYKEITELIAALRSSQ